MERCERTGDEGRVRNRCLSAATACLCLQSESHYNTEALVCAYEHVYSRLCVCVFVTLKSYITIRCSAGNAVQMNPRMPFYWI